MRAAHTYGHIDIERRLNQPCPQDPVTAESWEGVRDGSKKPSPCLLVPFGATVMGITLTPEELHGDEDCLYLNVFMPKVVSAVSWRRRRWRERCTKTDLFLDLYFSRFV